MVSNVELYCPVHFLHTDLDTITSLTLSGKHNDIKTVSGSIDMLVTTEIRSQL